MKSNAMSAQNYVKREAEEVETRGPPMLAPDIGERLQVGSMRSKNALKENRRKIKNCRRNFLCNFAPSCLTSKDFTAQRTLK